MHVDVHIDRVIINVTGADAEQLAEFGQKLDLIIAMLTEQGATLTELDDAVSAALTNATSDYAALNDKYLAALAAEAATADELAAAQAEQAAIIESQQAAIAALSSFDLDPTNPPPAEPPADPRRTLPRMVVAADASARSGAGVRPSARTLRALGPAEGRAASERARMPRYRSTINHNGMTRDELVEIAPDEVPRWEYEIGKGFLVPVDEPKPKPKPKAKRAPASSDEVRRELGLPLTRP